MTKYETISLWLYAIQSVVLIIVLVVYAKQLAAMREQVAAARSGSIGQNLLELSNFLQAEDVREARRVVIEKLPNRDMTSWSAEETSAAAKVCSSYGTAGVVVETGAVPIDAVIEHWGPSIRRCHGILEPFIRDRQRLNGATYWAVFDRLFALADKALKT